MLSGHDLHSVDSPLKLALQFHTQCTRNGQFHEVPCICSWCVCVRRKICEPLLDEIQNLLKVYMKVDSVEYDDGDSTAEETSR